MTRDKCLKVLRLMKSGIKYALEHEESEEDKEIDKDQIDALELAIVDVKLMDLNCEDGVTNGDVIRAMFPQIEVEHNNSGIHDLMNVYNLDSNKVQFPTPLFTDWWNAPYKAKSEDKNANNEDLGDYPNEIPNQFDNLTGSINL